MLTDLRALIVEDSEADCALLTRALRQGGYSLVYKRVDSADGLRSTLNDQKWDVVISDYSMPGFSGAMALTIVREKDPDVPFIFLSGTIGEEVAVQAMRAGAQDYVLKGNLTRLLPAVQRELAEAHLRHQHKESEQKLRQLEKFEALGQMAGGIAHDFNNVIGIIMGWAELGCEEVPAGSRAARLFAHIRDQAVRAAGLTRQLLAYARRQILEPRNINLNDIIRECIPLPQKGVGEDIEIGTTLAPDLQITKADPGQIEQVLLNLCFNARDAMINGGQLLITTRNMQISERHHALPEDAPPGAYVELSVRDSGAGMDAGTRNRIFEPFFTTKEVGKGTGLGLSTVLGIVKQHQGHIEVESEPQKGTIIRVYLPVSAGTAETRRQPDETALKGGTETLLIVEDEAAVREMLQQMLTRLGYTVVAAQNGVEAFQTFEVQQQDISLAILDVVMPKMSGPEVCAKLRQIKPDLPVIFASGYAEQSAGLNSMVMSGLAFVIQKPFSLKHLARTIREALERPRRDGSKTEIALPSA